MTTRISNLTQEEQVILSHNLSQYLKDNPDDIIESCVDDLCQLQNVGRQTALIILYSIGQKLNNKEFDDCFS